MASVSASMATLAFNKSFSEVYGRCVKENKISMDMQKVYEKRLFTALFDSRVFNVPKEDVCNYFIWRQQDATRNSIQMVGRANFTHNELKGKSCNEVQEMLFINKGLNWNDIPTYQKRGACIFKEQYLLDNEDKTIRNRWSIDKNMPIFTKNREYIEKYL